MQHDYDGMNIHGLYTTYEKAAAVCAALNTTLTRQFSNLPWAVQEWEIDE